MTPTLEEHVRPRGIGDWLGFAIPISLVLGTMFVVQLKQSQAPYTWFELVASLLIAHRILNNFAQNWLSPSLAHLGPKILVALAGLSVGLLVSGFTARTAVIAYHLAFGIVGGAALAGVWYRQILVKRWTLIDSGFSIAALLTALQVFIQASKYPVSGVLHDHIGLSWGQSNYIADVLVVVAVLLWGRMRTARLSRIWLSIPITTAVAAIATLSRGAIVALAAAVIVSGLLELRRKTRAPLLKVLGLALVLIIVMLAYTQVVADRSGVGSGPQLQTDIATRQQLWGQSWHDFLSSPLSGTGLGNLHIPTIQSTSTQFSHNIELSILQQIGLLGLPFLLLMGLVAFGALRSGPREFRPTIVAALVMSQIEPVFEGVQAGLIIWSILFCAYYLSRSSLHEPMAIASSRSRQGSNFLARGEPGSSHR